MDWMRAARRELMAYNAFRADREEILERLADMDSDIRPNSSRLDGLPKAKGGLPRSTVEAAVLNREEWREQLTAQLQEVNCRLAPIERALAALNPQEREVIRLSYHSMGQGPESLGMSADTFNGIKYQALREVAWVLQSLNQDISKRRDQYA